MTGDRNPAVRLITAAPEIPGVMDALDELTKKGVAFSIGHRFVAPAQFFSSLVNPYEHFTALLILK